MGTQREFDKLQLQLQVTVARERMEAANVWAEMAKLEWFKALLAFNRACNRGKCND